MPSVEERGGGEVSRGGVVGTDYVHEEGVVTWDEGGEWFDYLLLPIIIIVRYPIGP